MESNRCRILFSGQPVARLGTMGPQGPHLVPVVFAVEEDTIVTAVDFKPKRTVHLQRLTNIEADARVSVLADHYENDWLHLWWVRADCTASVVDSGKRHEAAIKLLAAKYHQYQEERPTGPVIAMKVDRWSGWEANPE